MIRAQTADGLANEVSGKNVMCHLVFAGCVEIKTVFGIAGVNVDVEIENV